MRIAAVMTRCEENGELNHYGMHSCKSKERTPRKMKTKTAVLSGKPDAGNPHVRFDEGEVASAKPRRGSLLHKHMVRGFVCLAFAAGVSFAASAALPEDTPGFSTSSRFDPAARES